MIRQTVPDGYYPVSEVEFSHVIVTVMLYIYSTSAVKQGLFHGGIRHPCFSLVLYESHEWPRTKVGVRTPIPALQKIPLITKPVSIALPYCVVLQNTYACRLIEQKKSFFPMPKGRSTKSGARATDLL